MNTDMILPLLVMKLENLLNVGEENIGGVCDTSWHSLWLTGDRLHEALHKQLQVFDVLSLRLLHLLQHVPEEVCA